MGAHEIGYSNIDIYYEAPHKYPSGLKLSTKIPESRKKRMTSGIYYSVTPHIRFCDLDHSNFNHGASIA